MQGTDKGDEKLKTAFFFFPSISASAGGTIHTTFQALKELHGIQGLVIVFLTGQGRNLIKMDECNVHLSVSLIPQPGMAQLSSQSFSLEDTQNEAGS